MSAPGMPRARQGILSLTIKDKNALYSAYMQFVNNGGLFIPTSKKYKIGDEVFMLLSLMEEAERLPVAGRIIWITPVGAEGNRAAGIVRCGGNRSQRLRLCRAPAPGDGGGEIGRTTGNNAGFARPGSGEHQQRTIGVTNGLRLRLGEPLEQSQGQGFGPAHGANGSGSAGRVRLSNNPVLRSTLPRRSRHRVAAAGRG